jgi:transcriptional pleiotropic regulator of transition state genes
VGAGSRRSLDARRRELENMKSTGIVRKVDELGRVVIPIELRRTLQIAEKDALEIYVDGEKIILKKYEPACIFCGNADNIRIYKEKNICRDCLEEMKGLI